MISEELKKQIQELKDKKKKRETSSPMVADIAFEGDSIRCVKIEKKQNGFEVEFDYENSFIAYTMDEALEIAQEILK